MCKSYYSEKKPFKGDFLKNMTYTPEVSIKQDLWEKLMNTFLSSFKKENEDILTVQGTVLEDFLRI